MSNVSITVSLYFVHPILMVKMLRKNRRIPEGFALQRTKSTDAFVYVLFQSIYVHSHYFSISACTSDLVEPEHSWNRKR